MRSLYIAISAHAGIAAFAQQPARGICSSNSAQSDKQGDGSENTAEQGGVEGASTFEMPHAADGSVIEMSQEEAEDFYAPIGDIRGLTGRPDDFDEDFYPVEISPVPTGLLGDKRVTRAQKLAAKRAMKGVDRKLTYHNIPIPAEVTVNALGSRLYFSGPLGDNAIDLKTIDKVGGGAFKLERADDGRIQEIVLAGANKSVLGTARTLIHNKISGVVKGYLVYLQLSGVGFRVSKEVKDITYEIPN